MAKHVIGVFDNESTGDQVVAELVTAGFDRSTVYLYRGDRSDLITQLQNAGVEAEDARGYASSVGREGALVVVQTEDTQTGEAVATMERYYASAAGGALGGAPAIAEARLEVVEERLDIGKREVERGGMRVRRVVSEREVEEQVTLRNVTIRVERRPADRLVGASDDNHFTETSFSFAETDEELVVAKETRIVEEVVVDKEVAQRTQTVRDTVRRADVELEQLGPGYGESLAKDPRDAGREGRGFEGEARTTWEEAQGSIKGAWDRLRGKG